MLKPEEVMKLLLPVDMDYIRQHGVDGKWLSEADYSYFGVRNPRRLMTQPPNRQKKPYTGLKYEFFDGSGQLARCTEIKNGYPFGDDISFYESGALASYERMDEDEHYRYDWYENGALKAVTEWNRKDNPDYYRKRVFDAAGRPFGMKTVCEIQAIYQPDAAESPLDFTFHGNGEFRQITVKAPSVHDLYTGIGFDPDGIPLHFAVNPHYTEDSLDKRLKDGLPRCEPFRRGKYRLYRGYLECRRYSRKSGFYWWHASACIHFRNGRNGDSIFEYDRGKQHGKQCIYDPSGKIQEQYFLSKEKEYRHHIFWYPNGMIREAIFYTYGGAVMLYVTFDDQGSLLSYQLNSDVFKGK